MAFGQVSGPPATSKQVQELLTLLQEAGHADFRDARGPMGFTQRQAAGKFTRDEAAALIERLQNGDGASPESLATRAPRRIDPGRHPSATAGVASALTQIPSKHLAAELQRRGWMVIEPIEGL
jgi:hypothetical protein